MATIRKRKLASGKTAWLVDYNDQAGHRRYRQFKRRVDADTYLVRARAEVAGGLHTPYSNSATFDAAADLWLDACAEAGLESSSIDSYRQHVDIHLRPVLGPTRLSQLTIATIRDLEDRLRSGRIDDDPRKRSADMVRRVIRTLGTLLADAQERGLVARNVVRELKSARRPGADRRADRRQKGRLKVGVDIPSPTEIRVFIAALEGRWRPILMTATLTGLRASELRGLRWQDIDFKSGELHVRQRADLRNKIGPPKSAAGERSVPLPGPLVAVLREWKLACPLSALDLAFPNGRGHVESHTNIVKRGLQPAMIRAGLFTDGRRARYPGLHALRHFYASWCINRVADGGLALPPKVVQERLGHATIVLTMDRYGHLFPRGDDGAEMAAAVSVLLG